MKRKVPKGWRKTSKANVSKFKKPGVYEDEIFEVYKSTNNKTFISVAKEVPDARANYLMFRKSEDGRKNHTEEYKSLEKLHEDIFEYMSDHPNG